MKLFLFLLIVCVSFVSATELEIWVVQGSAKNALQPAITAFEKDYPQHKIVVLVDEQEHIVEKARKLKEKGADIVVWGHDIIGKCIAEDFIVPLEFSNDLKESLVPQAIEAVVVNGKPWAYPRNVEFISLIYRKDKVDEKELKGDFEKIIAKYSCAWELPNWYFTFPFFGKGFSNCEELLQVIKGEKFQKNARDFAKLLAYLPKDVDASASVEGFISGKYSIIVNGPWVHADIKAKGVDFGTVPLSNFELGGEGLRPFLGVQAFLLNRYKPNQELAKLLIEKYLLDPKNQVASYGFDPRPPSTQKAIAELGISKIEGIPMPKDTSTFAMWGIMENFLQKLIKDGISEELFTEAANKLKAAEK